MTSTPLPTPALRIREEVVRAALEKVAAEAPANKTFAAVGFWNGEVTEFRLLYRNRRMVGPEWRLGAVIAKKPGQSWDFGVSGALYF